MIRVFFRLYRRARAVLVRRSALLAWRTEQRVRRAWAGHHGRVASSATYAAVTAIVVAGVFGFTPPADVFSAVVGAVLGVFSIQRQERSPRPRSAFNDDWA